MWYNLKHPNRHISVYPFTYQSVMQGLLVFSFREACHPMVDMLTCGRQLRLHWIFAYIFLDMF